MSALAGYWQLGGQDDAARHCRAMLTAQRIYGPHDNNLWDGGDIALGRNLFRLLPEDRFDRQPLTGADGRYTLVADARLDDRDDLARALGVDARPLSDADLLLQAWERWRHDAFDRLYGDYAFALWDAAEHELVLARDALGGRPLHYHRGEGFTAFASMPKGLHALEAIPRAPDAERSLQFLALIPERGPRSFFEGVSRVELGQAVTIGLNGIATRDHWAPRRSMIALPSFDAYVEAARSELDRAVANRLRGAERHVGAHLSAGFDSAGVAATAARLLAPGGGRVTAFTAVPRKDFHGPVNRGTFGDESGLAGATAALHPNIEHLLVRPEGRTVLDDLDRDFYLFDRPLANAQVWQFWNRINAEGQKRNLTVMLNGGFGNLTLSYSGLPLLTGLADRGELLRLFREARALMREGHARWPGVLALTIGPHLPGWLWNVSRRLRGRRVSSLELSAVIHPDRFAELHAIAGEKEMDFHYRPIRDGFESRLRTLRAIDFGNNRKGALAGWGIDMRDPTADRRLVEFCLSIPDHIYLRNGTPRALARAVLADRVPASVLREKRRGAQTADLHEEMTADSARLRDETARLAEIPAAAALLDLARMRQLIDEWPDDAAWQTEQTRATYGYALLRGVVAGHFLRKASRSNA